MTKSKLGATCAAVLLSATFVSAQTTAQRSKRHHHSRPDPTPSATVAAAKGDPQVATLAGCVVRDAANGGNATIKSNGISYKLTARNDQDFSQYLGKKVEVTGTLTTGQAEQRATSGKADDAAAPKEQTAVGGQKDVPITGAARDNTDTNAGDPEVHGTPKDQVPLATDKGTTADLTGRVDVKTIKTVAGSCL